MLIGTLDLAYNEDGTPARGVYTATCGGIVTRGRSPEHGLARALIAAGSDPDVPYSTQWADGRLSMRWPRLSDAAHWTVNENDSGLHVRRWIAFSTAPVASAAAEEGAGGVIVPETPPGRS